MPLGGYEAGLTAVRPIGAAGRGAADEDAKRAGHDDGSSAACAARETDDTVGGAEPAAQSASSNSTGVDTAARADVVPEFIEDEVQDPKCVVIPYTPSPADREEHELLGHVQYR